MNRKIIEKIEDIEKRYFGNYKDEYDLEMGWSGQQENKNKQNKSL